MKKTILILTLTILALTTMNGQTYNSLWKQAEAAAQSDQPRTEYDILMKIVKKASGEQAAGQLLKAELRGASVMSQVSPDSLLPAVERMEARMDNTRDDVLRVVYQTVLRRIAAENPSLERKVEAVELSPALCAKLAAVKAADYEPLTVRGADSRVFGHDLLSVIGYETENYRALTDYYSSVGNRPAALLTALELLRKNQPAGRYALDKAGYLQQLDSLITLYDDLAECGEVALERFRYMENHTDATPEHLCQYIDKALARWSGWPRISSLRNDYNNLTNSTFTATTEPNLSVPGKERKLLLENIRALDQLTVKLYKVKTTGEEEYNPSNDADYRKLKPLLTAMPELTQTHRYEGHKAYELFRDTFTLKPLPVGVYLMEIESVPATTVARQMYYVSGLRVMYEALPDNKTRYVVVDAASGQPVKGATLRLSRSRSDKDVQEHTTNGDGEAMVSYTGNRPNRVYVSTAQDKAFPVGSFYGMFSSQDRLSTYTDIMLFTDRAIYRPGQTVRVSAVSYERDLNREFHALEGKNVTMELLDANGKTIAEKTLTTDCYGACDTEFVLPSGGLTGQFSIRVGNNYCRFRVEEYKRPVFEVKFDDVNQRYADGDTLTVRAVAKTYSGVAVAGAKVSYSVKRRRAWWWRPAMFYSSYPYGGDFNGDEEIAAGEGVTEADGSVTIQMPMVLPKTDYPMFFNFVCVADVTDLGGESHQAQLSLPLGNRTTDFSCVLADKLLSEDGPKVTFHQRNAAGNDISASLRYRIDNGKWQTATTNQAVPLSPTPLKSGKHELTAICGTDTLKHSFTVFSLDDKRPAAETDDWFYASHTQFPNDGSPVTIQVGSSDKDVHIVYSLISGKTVLESGFADKSNELINRKLTYKEQYGDGILLTFAWVKDGRFYHHEQSISRPLPDKRLHLAWNTFRDKLTPGQQEEWTLTVKKPDGTPADAMLMATLYDKSLDQLQQLHWMFSPQQRLSIPHANWNSPATGGIYFYGHKNIKWLETPEFTLTRFDDTVFPKPYIMFRTNTLRMRGLGRVKASGLTVGKDFVSAEAKMASADDGVLSEAPLAVGGIAKEEVEQALQGRIAGLDIVSAKESGSAPANVQLRENLQETAFFYPRLTTDTAGTVAIRFTLPESVTTWHFMGLAHTKDLCHGLLEGDAVAKKELMVTPNMPRFLREGDQATITVRIANTSENDMSGNAWLTLTDPETDKAVTTLSAPFQAKAGETTSVTFKLKDTLEGQSLLVAKVTAAAGDFSDGEQHYLPILPRHERVTVTVPFTQNEPGTKTVDLTNLFPQDGTTLKPQTSKLTVEYTNNPAWLMVQALPAVGHPYDDCAVCQATALYANAIAESIVKRIPQAKQVFEQWKREQGSQTSLYSQLEKNQELKDLVLNETPWVMDADRESEQRQRLADFFDENLMQQRLASALGKLKGLQKDDGSWSWWPGMEGSHYMTVEISQMLVRMNAMISVDGMGDKQLKDDTKAMVDRAFSFMGKETVKRVNEMKKWEKKGVRPTFPGITTLQWLYICKLDGRRLPADVQKANQYLTELLKKTIKSQTIYEKALASIVLGSKAYIKSLKEYTVYKEEMGRYYDTPRAAYSWRDYRIPTQVAAIEAISRLTPADTQTLDEMRRWLLQQKRTQAWDTPLNSVDAIYAFMGTTSLNTNGTINLTGDNASLAVDGQPLDTPKATAGIGYVKTAQTYNGEKTFTAEKTSGGTSWGAVYAQFMQATGDIKDQASAISVKREILATTADGRTAAATALTVGSRVKVRITIVSDRDLDFVQLIDKRAACMEPVIQLSGYRNGCYVTPKDNQTCFYFDRLPKGKHVVETEYYIDRTGQYETGTCTVQCAYASEYRGMTHSETITAE